MQWPPIQHPSMIFGNPGSQIVLVTLWTPATEVLKYADKDIFALSAPLYSRKRGISPLIRTLLSNKNIRYVLVTGADLDGVGDALSALFVSGVKHHQIVGTDVVIDDEISLASIRSMIANVSLVDLRTIKGKQWKKINEVVASLQRLPSYGKAEHFALPKIDPPTTMPSTDGGFFVHGRTLFEAHVKILQMILRFGEIKRHTAGEHTKDLAGVHVVIDSIDFDRRLPFTKKEGVAYQQQILNGKAKGVPYSYGKRLRSWFGTDQLDDVVRLLQKNAYTRKGVLQLWDATDDLKNNSCPGVMYAHVAIVNHKTVLTVHVRCMEATQGIAQTVFGFAGIQEYIAEKTGFEAGGMIVAVDCAYVEANASKRTAGYVAKHLDEVTAVKHDDPRGNLVISVMNGVILVTHVSRDDKVLGEWRGRTAKEIYRQLASQSVLFDAYHMFDIGAELQKAQIALKEGKTYHQDRSL